MACDTRVAPKQTFAQRREEVRRAIANLNTLLISRRIKPVIGPQGGITFQGWSDTDKSQVSDACAYRLIMATGSALARAEIAKAETLSGRGVSRAVVNSGVHSHDGVNWEKH